MSHRNLRRLFDGAASLAGGVAVATLVAGALAAGATLTAAPADAAIKFKKLDVKNRTRGRPILTARLINGRWQVKSADKMYFDLTVYIQSRKNRLEQAWIKVGGTEHRVWKGKKTWKLRITPLRFSLAGSELGNLQAFGANYCGNKNPSGSGVHRYAKSFQVIFFIFDHRGRRAEKSRDVSGFVYCIR